MGSSRTVSRRLIVGLATGAMTLGITGVAQNASAAPSPHALAGTTPKWLREAKVDGHTGSAERVNFGVLLGMRNQAGAEAAVRALTTPGSASYGKWLTNKQFAAAYAPSAAAVSATRAWLRAQGFTVASTLPSGMYIEVSGTARQVEKTFGTTLNDYTYKGIRVHANATQLSLPASTPAAVTAAVAGVIGVDQGSVLTQPAVTTVPPGPAPGFRTGVQPCSAYYGQKVATDQPKAYGAHQPYAVCGYGPQQYQSAYGETALLTKGVDGRGVTVAITDAYASPTIASDAQQYNRVHGQPVFKAGQLTQVLPKVFDSIKLCGGNGWYVEETLDVEAVHAMAPGADVMFVGGRDCLGGLDEAWAETIDKHRADIVTNSWGNATDDVNVIGTDVVAFFQQFSVEAALTGITVNFSSGDAGDQTAGGTNLAGKTVDFPADLPYVTGVGGTSVQIGAKGQWVAEYGWQNAYSALSGSSWGPAAYNSGGGGGTSVLFAQPFYQKGKVPASISKYWGGPAMRAVPDIAMPGDPNTGFEVGQTQVFPHGTYWAQYRIGGTSLSSPLLAGVIALSDQLNGGPLGFVNPLYYKLLGTKALHDIAAPSKPVAQVRTDFANGVNSAAGVFFRLQTIDVQSSTLHDTKGYDDETGVGTPNGPWFDLGLALAAH
jgi:subtilase family serine protease